MIRLTIWLRDGRQLSGVYDWVGAFTRLQSLADLDRVARWTWEAP